MTSQMSHMKTIAQINCTIESHDTSLELDDVMHKIQKSWLLGIHGNMIDRHGEATQVHTKTPEN